MFRTILQQLYNGPATNSQIAYQHKLIALNIKALSAIGTLNSSSKHKPKQQKMIRTMLSSLTFKMGKYNYLTSNCYLENGSRSLKLVRMCETGQRCYVIIMQNVKDLSNRHFYISSVPVTLKLGQSHHNWYESVDLNTDLSPCTV